MSAPTNDRVPWDADTASPGMSTPQLAAVTDAFQELREQIANAPSATVMDAVVAVTAERITAARAVSITVQRKDGFETAASTDELARRADSIQYQLKSG